MVTLDMLKEAATSRLEHRYVAQVVDAEVRLTHDLSDIRAKRKRLYQQLYSDHSQSYVRTFFFDMAKREYTERCLVIDDTIQGLKEEQKHG